MYRPQKLAAVLLSAAFLCTTGIALADKGGNHSKHGSSAQGGPAAPGEKNPGADSKAVSERGPGGIGGPRSAPGDFDRTMGRNGLMGEGARGSEFEGRAGDGDTFGAGAKAGVHVKLANGGMHDFDISGAALNSLKAHQGRDDLIFFTNGSQQITAVCARGEKDNMRVTARTGDTFTMQDQSGQTRMITLDSKTASRLHVKVGSDLQVTALSATSGRVVALDLIKKHDFDKFARGSKSDFDVAKLDVDRQKVDFDTKKIDRDRENIRTKGDEDVAKIDMDRRDVDRDQVKLDVDKAKGKKADVDADQRKLDNDKKKSDRDIAKADFDAKKAKKSDVDVAKSDVDSKGHKAKDRKDKEVADADVKAGGMGKCGHGSSRNGNPAFGNQMSKDAANDASGHNPPGLPHECVNPAGHTRGFCKSSSSEGICGTGGGSGGSDNDVATTISKPCDRGTSSKSHGNPAYANQMAKDAANDASGHNPPGLPHECVNPAGHTRGFCKSHDSSSSAMCGGGSSGGISPTDLHGGIASATVPAPVRGTTPRRAFPNTGGGDRGPGAPVGMIPVAGGNFPGSGTRGSTRGGSPTHVLGASVGPTGGRTRHIAALPTRVLPVAIQPVGKRRCVWYKTGVLGASTGPYRIIGTSAVGGKPVLRKKCR